MKEKGLYLVPTRLASYRTMQSVDHYPPQIAAKARAAAALLGVDAETGKLADIVAVPGNVLDDIHATEQPAFVMQQGQVIVGAM